MRLQILTVFLIGSACAVNIPSTSYFTYHDPYQTQNSVIGSQSFSEQFKFFGPYLKSTAKVPTQMCPPATAPCTKSRYRTLDGSCNNLYNPSWGVANNRYGRLLTPRYGDGVSSPTQSVTGQDLPNPRLVSLTVFGERDVPDRELTIANMQWGQIVTHDMSLTAGGTQSRKHTTRCCTDDGKLLTSGLHSTCYPIIVPKNDPAHSQTGTECMNFVRTLTDRDNNCLDATEKPYAEQLSVVTAYMDLSLVYGNSGAENQPIRAYYGGRMLVDTRKGNEWPPQNPNASTACDLQSPQETCYLTGDMRINQNPGLTIMQIVLLREHNRIADNLQAFNPHWSDETIFQEARRINIAESQHINYYEWLPLMLGHENMLKNQLIYQKAHGSEYINDYNPNVDPSVLNSHATAAFRYFHTQIEGQLDFVAEERTVANSIRLSDWFNRPVVVESGDNFDFLSRGMTTQPQETTDINNDVEIKHFLFRRGRPFGLDLKAFDIQRNRDHGLASYNDFREFCGVGRAHGWEDFLDFISPASIDKLKSLYESHEDVELTVGGALERHVEGALAGPTFLCILTEQFYRTRAGDRFFYENGDTETAFTPEQLKEIRKASMARLFCDNGNSIKQMQPAAFRRVSPSNQIVSCSQIPYVDLSLWRDHSAVEAVNSDYTIYNSPLLVKK